ncbi:GntR family transcriptional regulator [Pollutimonas bauzanensis]|uniref:GntR family transcriptional regulator n=1 Tax=Pollutimonas bauzanensis TaxID=658167 RepID=A0A1M5V4E2_9BURK|nr:GntR family transcriptional regulator [Pollutimonas bauzanensis]SHH69964.1 GntR family transcriptional regulator [Pollutimonas bauzanensis]
MSDAKTSSSILARSRQPLYLQLAAEFRRSIDSGAWPVGHQVPTLQDLMQTYKVSRMTLRNALGELESDKLIRRGRGKGTFVERRPAGVTELELPTTWEEAVALSDVLGTQAIVESEQVISSLPDMGMRCRGAAAPTYQYLCRLHSKDDVPYCYSEVYIASDLFRKHKKQFKKSAAASVIARIPGLVVSESRQKLTIINAGFQSARALQLQVGESVAEVRRFACADGVLIHYARLEFPTKFVKFELDMLRPSRARQRARG